MKPDDRPTTKVGKKRASLKRWHDTGITADMSSGQMVGIQIEDDRIAIYCVNGDFHATDNICTHAFALLTDGWLDNSVIECPLHGGRFDIRSGQALGLPVTRNLRVFPVRVQNLRIEIFCECPA